MPPLINLKGERNFEGYTLLVPSVSVGNVPQLTIDLLISSLNFEKRGTLWHPAIVACAGGDPYWNSNEISTACEFYANESLKLAAVQLRTTIHSKLALKFFDEFRNMVEELRFDEVVILGSGFEYQMHDITAGKFYYVSNEDVEEVMSRCNVKQLEKDLQGKYNVPGSGFAVKLFEVLSAHVKCTLLFKYVSEGDNRPDAIMTIEVLCKFIETLGGGFEIRHPSSWNYVFGGPPPLGMY